MTFYLKYRPQKVSELDLTSVRESLGKIVGSENIPHAFLFSGPKGAGKTSTARILAKAVNCLNPEKNGEPCNECDQCLAITKGSSLDVLEIDAASHRGVDDIRSLRETIKLSPAGSKKKVYIIDEAHMLTTEAANALLKTLEEPPSHALFILATTAPEKLPDTIRSRATNVNFSQGTIEEIAGSLKKVVEGEKIEIEEKALAEIAKKAGGSFREAHKILEQTSLGNKKISLENVNKIVSGGVANPEAFLQFISSGKAKEALEEIDNLVQNGVNLRVFTSEAIGMLRRGMLEKLRKGETPQEIGLIELLSEAYRLMPTAVLPQLPLEMVVAKRVGKEGSQSIHSSSNSASSENEKLEVRSAKSHVTHQSEAVPTSHISYPISDAEEKLEAQVIENIAVIKIGAEDLESKWKEIMKTTKLKNHSVEALLRACRPAGFDGRSLTVEVFYKFHKDRLEQGNYRDLVEISAEEVLGIKPVKLVCLLSQTKRRASDVVNITSPQEEELVKLAEEIFSGTSDGKVH